MNISVVIPAFNEQEHIASCLDALLLQTTRLDFEVILVDNCSTDKTVAIARKYLKKLNLRIVSESKQGRGAARWRGFSVATGEILLSTDADAVVPPEWIDTMVGTLLSAPDIVAVTGCPLLTGCAPAQNKIFNALVPWVLRMNLLWHGHMGLSGFSFAVKKRVYDRAGGFDPESDAYEDLDLGIRVHRFGKIKFVTLSRVIFSGRRFNQGLIKGSLEYVTTFFSKFVFKKKRVMLSNVK